MCIWPSFFFTEGWLFLLRFFAKVSILLACPRTGNMRSTVAAAVLLAGPVATYTDIVHKRFMVKVKSRFLSRF